MASHFCARPAYNVTGPLEPETFCYPWRRGYRPGLTTGVTLNGNCYTNCSEICTTPALLFSSQAVFEQCLPLTLPSWEPLQPYNSSFLQDFGRMNSTIVQLINTCMEEYCQAPDPTLKGCPHEPFNFSTRSPWFDTSFGSCNASLRANSDIGGPGVSISYLIQSALGWLLWIAYFHQPLMRWLRKRGHIRTQPSSREKEWQAIVKSMLPTFQEAQCFLTIAIQTATFVAVANNKTLGSTSTAQTAANCSYIAATGLLESAMNTNGWVLLKITDLRSTYHDTISLISVTMVMACLILTGYGGLCGHVDDASRLEPFPVRNLESCGNRPPPVVYCLGLGTGRIWFVSPLGTLLCTFIIAFLPFKGFWRIMLAVGAIYGSGLCTIIALDRIRSLYSQGIIDPEGWNTGQIIAVFIWFPTLAQWIYWTWGGMNGFSKMRIAKPYLIVDTSTTAGADGETVELTDAGSTTSSTSHAQRGNSTRSSRPTSSTAVNNPASALDMAEQGQLQRRVNSFGRENE